MDIFSTGILTRVVSSLIRPPSFLLDRFFPNVQTETTEEIHFDVENKTRRIAPFVSPVVAGQVIASQGHTVSTFKPAYIKDKRVFDASRPLKRAIGEQIGGALEPQDRIRLILASELKDQVEMVDRRLELMAAQALTTGKVTVTGEQYPTVVVDYGRAAGQTLARLAEAKRWGANGVKPLQDLQTWAQIVLKASGSMPTDVVMTVDVWAKFSDDADVKARLLQPRSSDTVRLDAAMVEGGVFMGTVAGFNIFVYSGWYIDPEDGQEKPILPDGTVIMGSAQVEGYRAFGAIRDEEAGYQAMPYFPKSWVEKDPSVRYLLMQSAPLVVPYRPNATLSVTVL